ncbi:hypothetical protein K4F52_010380, partial [Lecanicillium sp. MT-2017a]
FGFQSAPPPLDDVERLDEVAEAARSAVEGGQALEGLANHLRAQLFYFELDETDPPQFVNGSFVCKGAVLCRFRVGTPEFEALMTQLTDS